MLIPATAIPVSPAQAAQATGKGEHRHDSGIFRKIANVSPISKSFLRRAATSRLAAPLCAAVLTLLIGSLGAMTHITPIDTPAAQAESASTESPAVLAAQETMSTTDIDGTSLSTWPGAQGPTVTVWDGAGKLSDTDKESLHQNTLKVAVPSVVTSVDYLTFATNDENLNDTVLNHLKQYRPDLLSPDQTKYADGHLIVAVGFDPRQNGVFGGEDVVKSIDLRKQERLETIVDAAKPGLRKGHYADGMVESVVAAADPNYKASGNTISPGLAAGLAAGGAVTVAGIGAVIAASVTSRRTNQARANFDTVSREYGRVAADLEAIDVRAHSLTSSFANDELRRQWEDVKQRFLQLHTTMDHLTVDSPNKEFRRHHAALATAVEETTKMSQAEENINLLHDLENGNEEARRNQLQRLREDALKAKLDAPDDRYAAEYDSIMTRIDALVHNAASPTFMDEFTTILGDYQIVTKNMQENTMPEVLDKDDRVAPRIDSRDWNVGLGRNDFVPYLILSSWHSNDVAAAQSSSSSSVNTSYSSTSFSGAGGSSGW